MVAIIGILAAVAIPAYNSYQESAKVNTVLGSINNVTKAYNACLAVNNFDTCLGGSANATPTATTINSTLNPQPGTAILGSRAAAGTPPGCVSVEHTASGFQGCVEFTANGAVTKTASEAAIKATTAGTCSNAGVCDNTP